MPRLCILPALVALLFGVAGCGTMLNLDRGEFTSTEYPRRKIPVPFGGVSRDVQWISQGEVSSALDLPFSVAPDLVNQ